jgi:excisionase family DNA binding protein
MAAELIPLIKFLYTVPQAAESLGISPKSVWNYLASGELKARRIGRRKLVTRDSLERFAAKDHASRAPKEKEKQS